MELCTHADNSSFNDVRKINMINLLGRPKLDDYDDAFISEVPAARKWNLSTKLR